MDATGHDNKTRARNFFERPGPILLYDKQTYSLKWKVENGKKKKHQVGTVRAEDVPPFLNPAYALAPLCLLFSFIIKRLNDMEA